MGLKNNACAGLRWAQLWWVVCLRLGEPSWFLLKVILTSFHSQVIVVKSKTVMSRGWNEWCLSLWEGWAQKLAWEIQLLKQDPGVWLACLCGSNDAMKDVYLKNHDQTNPLSPKLCWVNPALRRWEQKVWEFKAALGYIASLRPIEAHLRTKQTWTNQRLTCASYLAPAFPLLHGQLSLRPFCWCLSWMVFKCSCN